ncbi:MAG: hypothetical protein M1341_02640 [Candidatus Thermoplasmatota archaeon]|jgi:hypothetical protein|nr:hypothetical protein [Candidatus Thermoplasmatota archaeon]
MTKIFLLKKSNRAIIDQVSADDLVGRQTLITKDASQYGMGDDEILLILEGSEESFRKATTIIGNSGTMLDGKKTEEVMRKVHEEEENADKGMGFLFG